MAKFNLTRNQQFVALRSSLSLIFLAVTVYFNYYPDALSTNGKLLVNFFLVGLIALVFYKYGDVFKARKAALRELREQKKAAK